MSVKTIIELVKAIMNDTSRIEIEGDLANKVYKLKIVGPLAWGVAFVAISGAVYLYLATPAATATTAGAGGVISFTGGTAAAATAVTILGISSTSVAISIGVAAGGVGAITTLRDKYQVVERSHNRMVLKRK